MRRVHWNSSETPAERNGEEKSRAQPELLKDCKEFRVTSETGSDFTVRRGDRHVNARTGFPTKPGEFANFPNSMVNFAPMEDSAEGILVLSPGDCLIQHKRFLKEPITCRLDRRQIRGN